MVHLGVGGGGGLQMRGGLKDKKQRRDLYFFQHCGANTTQIKFVQISV